MTNDNLIGAIIDPDEAAVRILGDDEVIAMIDSLHEEEDLDDAKEDQ